MENLSTLKEFYFDGVLDYQIKIRLFGDWLKIEGSDESASGYSRLGGTFIAGIEFLPLGWHTF